MLKIKYKGKKYKLYFHHVILDDVFECDKPWTHSTRCWIKDFGAATLRCSKKDRFTMAVGRKKSLLRVLQEAGISKKHRAKFWWPQYHKATGQEYPESVPVKKAKKKDKKKAKKKLRK